MLDILRAYCDVDGDKSDSTRSSQRVQQAWIDFASATDARRGVMPQKLLLHVMQLSSRPLQEQQHCWEHDSIQYHYPDGNAG